MQTVKTLPLIVGPITQRPFPVVLGTSQVIICLIRSAIGGISIMIIGGMALTFQATHRINSVYFLEILAFFLFCSVFFVGIFLLNYIFIFVVCNYYILVGRAYSGLKSLGRDGLYAVSPVGVGRSEEYAGLVRQAGLILFVVSIGIICASVSFIHQGATSLFLIGCGGSVIGILLSGGDIRAANIGIRSLGLMLVCGIGMSLIAPFFLPLDLAVWQVREHPFSLLVEMTAVAVLFSLRAKLRSDPVRARQEQLGIRPITGIVPALLGLALALAIAWIGRVLQDGAEFRAAAGRAAEQVRGAHQFYVISGSKNWTRGIGTHHRYTVAAWNDDEMVEIPVEWDEQDPPG